MCIRDSVHVHVHLQLYLYSNCMLHVHNIVHVHVHVHGVQCLHVIDCSTIIHMYIHSSHPQSVLPSQMLPASSSSRQQQRLNPQMKSASVDSSELLSSRGHIEPPYTHTSIPGIAISGSNPSPATTRAAGAHHGNQQHQHQLAAYMYGGDPSHRRHTSNIPSFQRDAPISQSFQAPFANNSGSTNAQAMHGGRKFPGSSSGGMLMTNAGIGGRGGEYPAMNSPPTNAKFSSSTATTGPPPTHPQPTGSYPHTSSHHVSSSVAQMQQHQQQYGQQFAPNHSQAATTNSSRALASTIAQSLASSRSVPPFTGHGSFPSSSRAPVTSVPNQVANIYQNLPLDFEQHQLALPPDDGHGSGHMSLPSYGSGGLQQQAQWPAGHTQQPPVPRDDTYLNYQQKGYRHHQHHEGGGMQPHGYHTGSDEVEKDSSPPSSFLPNQGQGHSQHGAPLSLNPHSLNQGLQHQALQSHHYRHSHQMPLSPDHSKKNLGEMGFSDVGRQQIPRVEADASDSLRSMHGMIGNPKGGVVNSNRPGMRQQPPVLAGNNLQPHMNASPHYQGQGVNHLSVRPASEFVNRPVQESRSSRDSHLPSSVPKHGAAVYVASQERHDQKSRSPLEQVILSKDSGGPEPDSDALSNVSMESGLNSPLGGGSQGNVNENTLEKGIDGEIRRAARNVKKQVARQESYVGAKGGVEAPYDPNLVCPSCGLEFRIGEIQKFKRHASTCTGT